MTQPSCPYDDRTRPYPYNSIIPEAENMYFVDATHSYLLSHTASRIDAAHTHPHILLSESSSRHGELNALRPVHPSYSLPPTRSDPSYGNPSYRNLCFPSPSETHNLWGAFHPSPNLYLNTTCTVPPLPFHHSASESTLYPNTFCRQPPWPTGSDRASFANEFLPGLPSDHMGAESPFHNSDSPSHTDFTPQPFSSAMDTSHPCLWTEDGATCNVMVQATRSQMNRHLHAYHGFGGSDTRQTRCCWSGCGETMQQGSIARHMVTCHLQAKVTCPTCSKKLSRQDVISKHQRVCPAAGAWR